MVTKFLLILSEDGIEYQFFTIAFINSLLVYENKFYLQLYLANCAYKIVDKQMIEYLDED